MKEKKYNLKFARRLTLNSHLGLSLMAILSILVSDMASGDLHANGSFLHPSTELITAKTMASIWPLETTSWFQSQSFAQMVERHNR